MTNLSTLTASWFTACYNDWNVLALYIETVGDGGEEFTANCKFETPPRSGERSSTEYFSQIEPDKQSRSPLSHEEGPQILI